MDLSIRAAEARDLDAIASIYEQGIEDGQATFDTRARAPSEFAAQLGGAPFLVGERDGRVVGYARVGSYSERACYAGVGELSIYVVRDTRGSGVGRTLTEALCDEAERRGFWKLIALIFPENAGSVALLERAGFREVGTYRRHGRLHGEWRDVILLERLLGEAAS